MSRAHQARSSVPEQWLSHECGFCGSKGGAYLMHYGLMRCSCGKFYWALQPKRNGPMVLFLHPGFEPIYDAHPSRI